MMKTDVKRRRLHRTLLDMRRDWWLYVMLVPGLLYITIFKYVPMYGITIAFKNYSVFKGYMASPWVGLEIF